MIVLRKSCDILTEGLLKNLKRYLSLHLCKLRLKINLKGRFAIIKIEKIPKRNRKIKNTNARNNVLIENTE